MQMAHVGCDIWIGNFFACDQKISAFEHAIHIWHPDQPGHCGCVAAAPPNHLVIEYREHDPFTEPLLDEVFSYACREGKMLIHCSAGLGRSPTMSLVALAARGVTPMSAMSHVAAAMWFEYPHRHAPMFDGKVLNQIFSWWERKQLRDAVLIV